ncbi:SDR family oxidoreductase [Xylella taiwanensis]|uniref:SDR family oxidoreductase n=1 Tax=Xylella taiwanensis TaxID=1444770 RepID=UPI001E39293A|nr:SDR family oxidoreductase [Xylella taiwanensis]MCD8469935.1 SDR family oxidoreductase [Xylella taiwanensis]
MTQTVSRILVTGASGQLGALVIEELLGMIHACHLIAAARDPKVLAAFSTRGVETCRLDYSDQASIDAALQGVDRVLLVSSNTIGQRFAQHRNVIEAAARADMGLFAYTSLLHADSSPLLLAQEHVQTEALLRASGMPYVLLRNGWYTENYTVSIGSALVHGAVFGSAGTGRIAAATRSDYAAAAAAVLVSDVDQNGRTYELAGDEAFTLAEYAAEIEKQSGKPVIYRDLPEAEYAAILTQGGLPESFAAILAQFDIGASQGGLFDDSHQLSALIGRPTTPLREVVSKALSETH